MPKPSNQVRSFPDLVRLKQQNSYYCGPAVLQMLAKYWGVELSQSEIAQVAGGDQKVQKQGMTVEELGMAARKLVPDLQFWYKKYATISDLSKLINDYKVPVGVEWQGVFDYPDEEADEDEDDDPGHFSIVTQINTKENYIYIADPDRHYFKKDRKFTLLQFERRWWDINEVWDKRVKKQRQVDDYHVLFVVGSGQMRDPEKLEMVRV